MHNLYKKIISKEPLRFYRITDWTFLILKARQLTGSTLPTSMRFFPHL